MLPLKLTLTNFCQHRHRVLDLAGDVIAITASNGFGKSNIFYALKNSLTGCMTPGAKKLEDDILDGASSFSVELEFVLNNGDLGKITRTVQRKGANSVVLEIRGKERTEVFRKSTEAIAKFEKLLGIHPREGCEAVIAEQRSIEDLLFAPASKRLSRFEAFLHGDTFTAPIKMLDAEKSALFIDELATDRKAALESSLKDTRLALASIQILERRQQSVTTSKKALAVAEKRQVAERHRPLRAAFLEAQRDLEGIARALQENAKTIASLPANLGQLIAEKEARLAALTQAWSTYNGVAQLQKETDQVAQSLSRATAQQAKSKAALQALELAADRHNKVQQALAYLQLQHQVIQAQLQQQRLAAAVAAGAATEEARTARKHELAEQCGRITGPLVTMRDAHVLLTKAQGQGHAAHCPVCQSELKDNHAQSLAALIAQLEQELAAPQAELRRVEQELGALTRDLAGQRRELSLLHEQLPRLTQQLAALPEPQDEFSRCSLDELRRMPTQAVSASQVREARALDAQQQKDVAHLEGRLASLRAKLPAENVAPAEPESRLTQWRNEVTALREQDRALAAALSAQRVQSDQQRALAGKLAALQTQAQGAGLPKLDGDFLLTDDETALLAELDLAAKELVSLEKSRATQEALIKQLETQLAQTEACIAGAKDTQAYALHLDSMVGYFKSLPQIIMKSQLQKLCLSMDEIIRGFHFFQPFRLAITDDLDFVLQYPNKLTRPIGKASGGERIILGVAFRLAAHRTLAPEMPWLAIDEPTNHLAEENISVMADLIQHLSTNLSRYHLKKLIISTHSPLIAAKASQQINLAA